MKYDATNINDLLLNTPHASLMQDLDAFITKNFTQATRYLFQSDSINLIGYQPMECSPPDPKTGQLWPLIAIAPQKNNVSLYIVGEKEHQPILSFYQHHFSKSSLGKHCVRIRSFESIDPTTLKAILQDALVWYTTQNIKEKP